MSQGNARWGVGATGSPGPTGPPGPAGPPGAGASGAALFELAPVASPRLIGRYSGGSGVMQEMVGPTAMGMMPVFTLTHAGLVPAPATSSNRVLQDDGTWVTQSGGGPTMLAAGNRREVQFNGGSGFDADSFFTYNPIRKTLTVNEVGLPPHAHSASSDKLATWTASGFANYATGIQVGASGATIQVGTVGGAGPLSTYSGFSFSGVYGVGNAQRALMQPLTLSGNPLGQSGAPQDLAAPTVASMLPLFRGSGVGMVPAPTGGAQARFLGDNGQWSIPLASGITNAQLAMRPPSIILGRSGSTGITEELVGSGVATLLPLFNDIDKGLVPGSAGGTTAFLRADGAWAIPAAAGGVSGVAFNQIVDVSPFKLLGRPSVTSGTIQELSPLTVASMLPRFLGSGFGLVPVATGGQLGAFLRDDGTWSTPAAGSATGVANNQLGPMPPFTLKGRTTLGSGVPEDLTLAQVASLLPRFLGSGSGEVPAPTGGNVRAFLRDDGQWQIPLASGIANAQLGAMLAPSIKGRSTIGSGVPEDLTGAQVASMLPWATSTTAGLVPVPTLAAATGAFLDSKGLFSTPTGLNNGQFALMPPSTIKANVGATGLPQDMVGSGVATLLPLFNDVHKGLVPGSAGGTTAFLRADGNWATPNAGGSPSGLLFNQIQDISSHRFLGRRPIGSGSIEQLTPEQVATMLPVFSGALRGMVPPPAGGGPSGFFLKDDGTWFPLLGPQVVRATSGGSQTLAGSMTVDFSSAAFHEVTVNANTKFYLTPPSMMRHTQIKFISGASGAHPTFFGSAVKWAGGSAMHPSLFSRGSGVVNFANFFWDGSVFHGSPGQSFA